MLQTTVNSGSVICKEILQKQTLYYAVYC